MPLGMRTECERCETGLAQDGTAFVCSYGCTFCEGCTTGMDGVCPNCGGELLRRPKRLLKKV